jgi:hypothetical protein
MQRLIRLGLISLSILVLGSLALAPSQAADPPDRAPQTQGRLVVFEGFLRCT